MEETNSPNPTQTEAIASNTINTSNAFPPIRQLFENTWSLLSRKILKILLINAYTFLGGISILLIAGIIGLITALSLSGGNWASLTELPSFFWIIGIVIIISIVISVIINLMAAAGLMLALNEKDETVSTFTLIKRGWPYVLPLFVVGLIELYIVLGSLFLFVIPMIIVSIFLAFTSYTIILDNKKSMDAIKMSVGIMQQHFGAIVGRFLLYILLVITVSILFGILESTIKEPQVVALISFARFIINTGLGWFGTVYGFLLYKHARAAYDESKPVSIMWMWIVSGLGWLIGALILYFAIQLAGQFDPSELIRKAVEQNQKNTEFNESGEYAPELPSSESEEFYEMFDEDTQEQLRQLQEIEENKQI